MRGHTIIPPNHTYDDTYTQNMQHTTTTVVAATTTATQVVTQDEKQENTVHIPLKKRTRKVVQWKEGTIDNEFLGKKSSKSNK